MSRSQRDSGTVVLALNVLFSHAWRILRTRNRRLDSLGGWLLVGTCFALVGSCAAPTLPLPPPSALVTAPDSAGLVHVSGSAVAGAYVSCVNERLALGVITIAGDTGEYELAIEGAPGDELVLWQERGSIRGPSVDLVVPSE